MKAKILIFFALILVSGAYSQSGLIPRKLLAISPDMTFVPAGTAKVPMPDNPDVIQTATFPAYYVSKEVTNREYKAFINDLKSNPSKKLVATQSRLGSGRARDSAIVAVYSVILKDVINTSSLPFEDYFTNEKYDNYPAVGVSEKNAQYYAVWRYKRDYQKVLANKSLGLAQYNIPEYLQKAYIESKGLPTKSKERIALDENGKGDYKGFYFVMVAPSYKK